MGEQMKINMFIEDEIKQKRNQLRTDRLDMSFGEIMSMFESGEIIISPEYQRLFRWDSYQQTRFIESLLLGIPIPPIFVAEDEKGKWELVDGLQRTSTILSFFGLLEAKPEKNNLVLTEGEILKDALNGLAIDTLPIKLKLSLKRSVCRVEIIRWDSAMDMRYELFNRLNTGGTPLTDQEIRNCIFRGIDNKFNALLQELGKEIRFVELLGVTEKKSEEMYYEELILRYFSLKNNMNSFKSLSHHMTEYMRKVTEQEVQFDYQYEKDLFFNIITLLEKIGPSVFRFDGKGYNGFSISLYDSIMVSMAEHFQAYSEKTLDVLNERIIEFKKDEEFKRVRSSGINSSRRMEALIKIAKEFFKL